ncbi:uncharacterized protein LOC8067520 [Sorghum bicolor]|uniref:uncharacterized protein LOC8067520 n=1 Tax=Sorghum bicolor TaxID=4558 RepID=UPI0001A8907C|nr:uncharacterized protein LOC8067520 [Sorghum bicolor]|eukprot:XP_002441387.1 uncharacterized protein LOC8067520 [Sorghum bicolor]
MVPMSGSGSTSGTGGGGAAKTHRMVTSCNGCRALRKGCSDGCTIRPCLQWIKSPEAQGNATHFLAKFYGRAGLLNLIAAAPAGADCQAVFRSLLYEACGRIVNPVYGAVGLLWSGQWPKCEDAVEAAFKGELGVPVHVVHVDAPPPPLGARLGPSSASYDIRHFAKDSDAAVAADLLRFARAAGRTGFKRGKGSPSYGSKAKLLKGNGEATKNVRASPSGSPPLGQQQEVAKELEPMPMVMEMELEHDGRRDEEFVGKGKAKAKATKNVRASPRPSPPLGQGQQQEAEAEAEELEPVPMVMDLLEHDGGRDEELPGSNDHHLKGKGSKENTDVEAAAFHVIQGEAEPPLGNQVLVADQEEEVVVPGLELALGFEPVPVVRQQPSGDQTGSSGLGL